MRVEGGDPRIGFVVGISRAHSVLPWEVLGGVGATGATSAGTRSRCPQNSPRLFGATLLFQLQEGGRGGKGGAVRVPHPRAYPWLCCHPPSRTWCHRTLSVRRERIRVPARNPFTRARTCKVPHARASRGPAAAVAAPVVLPADSRPSAPQSPGPSALGYSRLAGRGPYTD